MNFDLEMDALITRYLADTNSPIELAHMSKGLRTWTWWQALAHYKLNHHFATLEEVPDDYPGTWFTVITAQEKREYQKVNGTWRFDQKVTKEDCMRIY